MGNGVFIVFDGIDGSGKSEMVKLLHNYLFSKNKDYRILTTREPTNGKYGSQIRSILARDKNPKTNALRLLDLFINDRNEHVNETIIPFLRKKIGANIVICDRYYYSTIAFQSMQGLETKMLIDKNKNFPKPTIAFILDIKPQIALQRIKGRRKEKFERVDFMNELRKKFLDLPGLLKENIKIIDASRDKDKVFEKIKKEINRII